jgi:hypothetical protein
MFLSKRLFPRVTTQSEALAANDPKNLLREKTVVFMRSFLSSWLHLPFMLASSSVHPRFMFPNPPSSSLILAGLPCQQRTWAVAAPELSRS